MRHFFKTLMALLAISVGGQATAVAATTMTVNITVGASGSGSGSTTTQVPGPSASLYNSPYYTCSTNTYVSQTGSDTTGTGTSAKPWLTLAKAESALTGGSGGQCINVVASSAPYSGVNLTKSGVSATAGGYIVDRCTTLDGCTINGTAGPNNNDAFSAIGTDVADYRIIDGFTLTGNASVYGNGLQVAANPSSSGETFSSHHIWILNSIISGFGQAGIQFSQGDYNYAIHNTIYNNAMGSSCDNGAQGSGISDVVPINMSYQHAGYTPTADDKNNPNPIIGSFLAGSNLITKSFSWNVVYNNYLTPCGTGDTDGNNIIADQWWAWSYSGYGLISYNVVYNAGGNGIHVFMNGTSNVLVLNNSSYNNNGDPNNAGSARYAIGTNAGGQSQSGAVTFANNIGIGIPTSNANSGNCYPSGAAVSPYGQYNSAFEDGFSSGTPNSWQNNLSQLQGSYASTTCATEHPNNTTSTGSTAYCNNAGNLCNTAPGWVNVGNSSTGSESTPPVGVNFALGSGSAAIGKGAAAPAGYVAPSGASPTDVGACSHLLTKCP